MKTIDQVHIFIATDDEGEGVPAFRTADGWMPLLAADEARVDSLREIAQHIANESGKALTLARYTLREDLEVIEPQEQT